MQFGWIDFYSEFASKLLSFKNDRKTLISKINAVYAAIDMKVPKLESGDEIIDIDPFTVFGLFNKGITNANRIAIIGSIAKEFAVEAKVTDNFDGIPVLNKQQIKMIVLSAFVDNYNSTTYHFPILKQPAC